MGLGFLWGDRKVLKIEGVAVADMGDVLNAPGLHTLKWLIVRSMNFSSMKK